MLPCLQELRVKDCELTVPLLSQLLSATTLTKLHWDCSQPNLYHDDTWADKLPIGQAYALIWQRLQLLPQLSELTLHVGGLTAAEIAPLSNLQHLQRFELDNNWLVDDDSGPRQLLAALQHLTQLRHLQLQGTAPHMVSAQTEQQGASYQVSCQCFSALTASTQLTALILQNNRGMPTPQAAFNYLFPPGRILPHLKVLHLTGQPCVQAAQVEMIVASCPALKEVMLEGVTYKGFDISCLAQLPLNRMRVEWWPVLTLYRMRL
jgi:hypothetical protein